MAAPKVHKEYKTFVRGLITEASDLTFPEDASIDEDNCVLNRDGSRQRRQGMDYESGYELSSNIVKEEFSDNSISVIEWKNAANSGLFNFVVIQIGSNLHIHDMSTTAIGAKKATIDITEFKTPLSSNFGFEPIQGATGNGFLFCTSKDTIPFYIKYDTKEDKFIAVPIKIEIRDFIGIEDGSGKARIENAWKLYWLTDLFFGVTDWPDVGKRVFGVTSGATAIITQIVVTTLFKAGYALLKDVVGTFVAGEGFRVVGGDFNYMTVDSFAIHTTTSNDRNYNLLNQGWSQSNIDTYSSDTGSPPSHAQVWYFGKDSSDNWTSTRLDKQDFGTTPAFRGHYILDAFKFDRSYVSGLAVQTEYSVVEQNRPTTVAFYAGRVFYSGVESTPAASASSSPVFINSYIYFSQILEVISKAGNCYQEADPTSEHFSDLLDTDGGTILIPEVGKILKITVVDKFLIVIANNGVWSISGPEGGFSPNNYVVSKVSNVGALGPSSIVESEGVILYWSAAGIYALTLESVSQTIKAANITEKTIHSFYTSINTTARTLAKGIYDPAARQIRWLYSSDTDYNGVTNRYKFNRELIYDTVLGAFYTTTISSLASDSPYVAGVVATPNILTSTVASGVVVGTDAVQVVGISVNVTQDVPGEGTSSIKYLSAVPQSGDINFKYCFSRYKNATFLDWVTADSTGITYSSFLSTGFELLGDIARDKYSTYVTVHSKLTETGFVLDSNDNIQLENPSSLFMQGKWGWTDHSDSGRWSRPQQVYKFRRNYIPTGVSDGFTSGLRVVTTKNKVRGHGKALSIYFYSTEGKDFHLLGWATDFTGKEET